MRIPGHLGFIAGACLSALILQLVPFDGTRLSLSRLEDQLRTNTQFTVAVSRSCSVLTPTENTPILARLARRLTPGRGEGGGAQCRLRVQSAETTAFFLRTTLKHAVQVLREDGSIVTEDTSNSVFPRPMVLLPIAMFLLGLIFGVRRWNLPLTAATFLVLAWGGDLIRAGQSIGEGAFLVVTRDPVFHGLSLILAWLALFLQNEKPTPQTKDLPIRERRLGRIGSGTLAVWNPLIWSALGPLWYPLQRSVARIANFLDAQFLLAALSLYLLLPGATTFGDFLERSILLPRYLTFASVVFFGYALLQRSAGTAQSPWRSPRLLVGLAIAAAVEVLARFVPQLDAIAMPVRVGVALLLTELPRLRLAPLKLAAQRSAPWFGLLLLSCVVDTVVQKTGVVDMVIGLVDPRMHPTLVVFFTFVCSFLVGFTTGSFGTAFFALTAAFNGIESPAVRAALLDGLLAGAFLSPFSIVNVLPSGQFRIELGRVLRHRWRMMVVPLGITVVVSLLASMKSVSILQPVTFLMLCLTAIALKLSFRTWDVTKFAFFRQRLEENTPEQFVAPKTEAKAEHRKSG